MASRAILLAVCIGALIGCAKGSPSTADAPKGDPGATYVIKIREKKSGERYEVSRTLTESKMLFQGQGKDKPPAAPSIAKVPTKAAYTEEVLAVEGAAVTKGKRTYTVLEGEDFGKAKPLPFVGKTVEFESKGDKFTFTVDGKAVPVGIETFALDADSDRNKLKGVGNFIPDTAVKVGESWDVPAEKLTAIIGPEAKEANIKASGKLEKAYTKDGKQFGVVTLKMEGTFNEKGGKLLVELTYDGCIDGSVAESTRKSVETFKPPTGASGDPAFPEIVNSTERTIKPAK